MKCVDMRILLISIILFVIYLIFSASQPIEEWELRQKDNGGLRSVAEFSSNIQNGTMALNLVPATKCNPLGFYGCAWLHILDDDPSTATDGFRAAQLGINETDVVLGSIGFGNASPLPFTFRFDNRIAVFIDPFETQFRNGRIVIERSDTGVAIDLRRMGTSSGRIIVDDNGARLEGFSQIDDMLSRIRALEAP